MPGACWRPPCWPVDHSTSTQHRDPEPLLHRSPRNLCWLAVRELAGCDYPTELAQGALGGIPPFYDNNERQWKNQGDRKHNTVNQKVLYM